MSNSTQVTNILLRAGFVDAEHVQRSIAIHQGGQHTDISKIKANAVANLEADCKNGTIRKVTSSRADDYLLALNHFPNNGSRKVAVGSDYDSHSEDGTTSLSSTMPLW